MMPAKAEKPALTGEVLHELWRTPKSDGRRRSQRDLAEEVDLGFNAVHGRIWRYQKSLERGGVKEKPELFDVGLPMPLHLAGDWMIVGDVHAPCTDYDFATLLPAIAENHLSRPRRLIVAGDLINFDQFAYEEQRRITLPNWRKERIAARHLLEMWLQVFDEIVWLMGNHERRLSKKTRGELEADDLGRMVLDDPRVTVSLYGYCTIETPTGLWRVTHASNYSVNQLTVADALANKFQCHIISHHEHHLAIGWDRFKHHVIVNNGGLFDPQKLAYVVLDDSKSPGMVQGFTMLRGGYAHVFGPEPFTDWSQWLPAVAMRRAA
jgi:hypothetical protein